MAPQIDQPGLRSGDRRRAARVVLSIGALLPVSAQAGTKYWKASVGSGSWNTPSDWSVLNYTGTDNGGVPVSGDSVVLTCNDAISRIVSLTITPPTLTFLGIGNFGTGLSTLNQGPTSSMTMQYELIGLANNATAVGEHDQNGGTNTYTSFLSIGTNAGSAGIYSLYGIASLNLTGTSGVYNGELGLYLGSASTTGTLNQYGGIINASVPEYIGSGTSSVGFFNQSNGINIVGTSSANQNLYMGQTAGSVGNYNMSGAASLTVNGSEYVGYYGNGGVIQSSGSHTATQLTLGNYAGSAGSYLLSGGNLNVASYELVGNYGSGTFSQTAGVNTVSSFLEVASNSAASYNFGGGNLNVATTSVGSELIGNFPSSTGVFNQYGGTHTVGSTTEMSSFGIGTYGNGQYNLSAGTLNVWGLENIADVPGGTGVFLQTGGSNTAGGDLQLSAIGGTSSYTMNGSTASLTVKANLTVGGNETSSSGGNSAFTLINGTATVAGTLIVQSGTFNQSGGTLNSSQEEIGQSGNAVFTQTGGTHNASYGIQLGVSTGSTGTYNLINGTLNIGINSDNGLTVGESGIAYFNQSGGNCYISVAGPIGLFVGGNNSGSTDSESQYTLSGGSLVASVVPGAASPAADEEIGSPGSPGAFVQTGGSNTIGTSSQNSDLIIAAKGNGFASGSYSISGSGSRLSVYGNVGLGGDEYSGGGQGTLTISGGTTLVTGTVYVYGGSTLSIGGGTVTVGAIQNSGGTVNWTGGVVNITAMPLITIGLGGLFGATVSLNPGMSLGFNGQLILPMEGNLLYNGGSATYGFLEWTGGTIGGTGTINNSSLITGYGTFAGSGGLINSGTITQNTSNLVFTNSGNFNNTVGSTLNLSSGYQLQLNTAAAMLNSGTINLNGGVVSSTISATLQNLAGGLIAGPGSVQVPFAANYGVISEGAGALHLTGNLTNFGDIELTGSAAQINGINAATNYSTIGGSGTFISGTLNNYGTIEPTAGTLALNGTVYNLLGGILAAASGEKLSIHSGLSSNAGLVTLTGGTLDTATSSILNTGQITGYGTIRSGAFQNNGQLLFSGGPTTITGPVTTGSGSRIIVTGNATASFYNSVTIQSGASVEVDAGSTAVFFGSVNGTSFFTGGGTKDFEGGASTSGIISTTGATEVAAPASLTVDGFSENSLTVNGTVTLSAKNGGVGNTGTNLSTLGSLTVYQGGTLNLSNNDLLIHNGGLAAITQNVQIGYNSGRWNGQGIISAAAANDTKHLTALGVILNGTTYGTASGSLGLFDGTNPVPTDVLVKYTYYGDANLDGKVDGSDYSRIDSGYITHATGWFNGDFNYDGAIDGSDYTLIDNAYNSQGVSLASELASPNAIIAAQVSSTNAVPEPGSIGMLAMSWLALLGRRHRIR